MNNVNKYGHLLLTWTQDIGLLIIAISTIVAVGIEINVMIEAMTVTLADLLLLFIYLEVLAMVAIYLESGKLPVRMPIYIAIVALARDLQLEVIAEGVETVEQREALEALDCGFAQGFLFAQAVDAAQAEAMIAGGQRFS